MTSLVRPRTFLVPFAFAFLGVLLLLVGVAHAATGAASTGSDLPDVGASAARWYSDGRLAGPVVLGVYVLLRIVIAASNARTARLAWLRAPGRLAYVSSAVAALSVVLPAAASGGLTWGGLVVALGTGGALVANGTAKEPTEASTEEPAP